MAGTKISAMTPGSPLDGTELLEMTQGGSTFSTTSAQLAFAGVPVGTFLSAVDQTTVADTETAVVFEISEPSNTGVTIVNNGSGDPTRITVPKAAYYSLTFQLSVEGLAASDNNIYVWLRLNGSDVANSTVAVLAMNKLSGVSQITVSGGANMLLNENDYVEVFWAVPDPGIKLVALPSQVSPYARPAGASAVLHIYQFANS